MVDSAHWLGGRSEWGLDEQIDRVTRLARETKTVLPFVPYDPLRQLEEPGYTMRLVRRAIEEYGFTGVKLYPPMGFRLWNNRGMRGFTGRQFDDAMEELYAYCLENDVPSRRTQARRGRSASGG